MAGFDPNYYTKIRNGIVVSNIKLVPGNKLWEDCDFEKGGFIFEKFPRFTNYPMDLYVILPNYRSKFYVVVGKDV